MQIFADFKINSLELANFNEIESWGRILEQQSYRYLRVSRELEDAEDPEHPQGDERAAQVLVVGDSEPDVVREDRDDVDDAHDRAQVATPGGRRVQPQQVLAGEDHYARRVQAEQLHLDTHTHRQTTPRATRVAPGRLQQGSKAE